MTACDLMRSPGWSKLEDDALESRRDLVRKLIRRVTMKPGSLGTEIDRSAIVAELLQVWFSPNESRTLWSPASNVPSPSNAAASRCRWSSRMLLTGIARMLLLLLGL